MPLPNSTDAIDPGYLEPLLRAFLGEPRLTVGTINIEPLGRGTSAANLYTVVVQPAYGSNPVRLVLKLDAPGHLTEVQFYRDLAGRVDVDTPRVLDARIVGDGRAWLLIEDLAHAKDGLAWTEADYHDVVRDMARFHASLWEQTDSVDDCRWLWRPTREATQEQVAALRDHLATIESSGLARAVPDILSRKRLFLIKDVLERSEDVLRPMLAAGTTLVHGDYWFYNVQVLPHGRRVLLDWQECRVWSGLWELAYFLNLLHVAGRRRFSYREQLPVPEETLIGWYAEGLRARGVALTHGVFEDALACAYIWHPLLHWLPRLAQIGEEATRLPAWSLLSRTPPAVSALLAAAGYGAARRFLATTFDRWECAVNNRFG